ncbi:MAG: ComF family protein [Pseudomonadota bacterium]
MRASADTLNAMLGLLHDLLAPRCCAFCRLPTASELGACDACIQDLPWRRSATAEVPGLAVDLIVPFDYTFPLDAAIRAWKYRRREFYVPALVALMRDAAMQVADDIDAVVPVPLHWRRLAWRGFNQAEILACAVSEFLAVPQCHSVRRIVHTPAQSRLSAVQRRRNLQTAFVVDADLTERHVLLVDDVVTTGGTLAALANVLTKCGAAKVSAVALAQTPRR